MTYGLNCTPKQIEVLEQNNIDFDFYNVADLVDGNDKAEIEIHGTSEFQKALKLISE
jgi:hypothetical protein